MTMHTTASIDQTPWLDASRTCTAFHGGARLAAGPYADVARTLAVLTAPHEPVLVFDDHSGAQIDHPWPDPVVESPSSGGHSAEGSARGGGSVGRPRLGVVAREVTLLPRHWEWLSQQRGGASATLRRLVDEARRVHAAADHERQARERVYRFISAMAADWPGFEEATRALFAGDAGRLAQHTAHWAPDVRAYMTQLANCAPHTD